MNSSPRLFVTSVSALRFFILTFTLSWLIWIPLVLAHFGIAFNIPEPTIMIVRLLGVLMPAASALILTAVSGEKGAVRRLLSRLLLWRVSLKWWIAAVLVYPGLLVISALIVNAFGSPQIDLLSLDFASLIINSIFLLIAVLGEEIGWHGVALPAMQQKYNPVISSLILGVCWGAWHLPFWLMLDTYDQFGLVYLALNFAFVLPMTFYSTWFFNRTAYSLLLPVVFHLSFNIVNNAVLPATSNLGAFIVLMVLSWLLFIVILPSLRAATPGN